MSKQIFLCIALNIFIVTSLSAQTQQINITTAKDKYLHYELVNITAGRNVEIPDDAVLPEVLTVEISRDEIPVTSIGKLKEVILQYDPTLKIWEGKWPIPWNAPRGNYTVSVDTHQFTNVTFTDTEFEVIARIPPEIESDLYILTVESGSELKTMQIPAPDGTGGGWQNIIEWAKFIGANTIWYLGGQTSGWREKIDEDFPWNKSNFEMLGEFAQEIHRNGLKFGVWVSAYLTFGKKEYRVNKYTYAWNYDEESDECIHTDRTISLGDDKRKQDIIDFIKQVSQIPEVDYIGLDYIRNAFGGYEMVDEFVLDMNPDLPVDWPLHPQNEKMKWLAKKVIKRDDTKLIDQWNWWRAHYVANILKEIKEASSISQPLWVFTLSWEKGWQHGQDPVMMNDAGADIDAVMLYEADNWQFDQLLEEWHSYVKREQVNLIVGNQVDWIVHQSTLNPAGPEEFYTRIVRGSSRIYNDSKVLGIFFHDLIRALWGRTGPYPSLEWAVAGGAAFSKLKEEKEKISLSTTIMTPDEIKEDESFKVTITVENLTDEAIEDINIKLFDTEGLTFTRQNTKTIPHIKGESPKTVNFTVKVNDVSLLREGLYMIAVLTSWQEGEITEKYICFDYVQINNSNEQEAVILDTE